MNIVSLLNQIKSDEIVLPAIQRDFVWSEEKLERLMDSIMRGYPIGIVLMWETYSDIQYRKFASTYRADSKTVFFDNTTQQKLRLVLDGQQRLQSLYLALYGQYEGKFLYFDVLSGRESDDFEEEKYHFYFATAADAKIWNEEMEELAADKESDSQEFAYYVKVMDLFRLDVSQKQKYRKQVCRTLQLDDADELRLETNLAVLDEVLTKDQNILKASIIDENKPSDSSSRKTESDVLEIFVRINRQGMPLSRSDLIFSMLKLNWKESATALPDFVSKVNEGNSFEIDIDFVIRCLFAVSDLGTKFDIDLLRKKTHMQKLQSNFGKCCSAIQSVVDAVQQHGGVANSKALGGLSNLVPFVYYLFQIKGHELPNNQVANFRKSLFLFGFSGPFSRYADSRLGKFIKDELREIPGRDINRFPVDRAVWWVNYWESVTGFNGDLIQRNPRLAHYILQQDSGSKVHFAMNAREMDHIFPRSTLKEKGFDEAKINHFANFWILGKNKNINKTNKPPSKYFEDVDDKQLAKALIDREMLDYRRYRKFIEHRGEAIIDGLAKKIGIGEQDFLVLQH